MRRTASTLPTLAAIAILSGCGDPLKKPQLIEDTRVIGARTEVQGDPSRAWPRPGEAASVRWLVAYPGDPVPVSWAFQVCPAEDVAFGVPKCDSPPFESVRQLNPSVDEPRVDLVVPPELAGGNVDELAVLGVVCTSGTPTLADSLEKSGCSGGAGQRVSFTFGVQLGETTNRNPDLADATFELDAAEWLPAEGLGTSCSEAGQVPQVDAGSDHVLAFEIAESDREPLEVEYDFDETSEAIQISQFSTGGDLDRAYSVVEGDLPNRVEVGWTAPREVASDGQVVRFYFVARDPRGGADWAVRTLCVTP